MASQMFDVGRSGVDKLRDRLSDAELGRLMDECEGFERRFEENQEREFPRHPYKVYREIERERDLSDEEYLVLEELKKEYVSEWRELKRERSSHPRELEDDADAVA